MITSGTGDGWQGQLSSELPCMFLGAIDGIKIDTDDDIVIFRRIINYELHDSRYGVFELMSALAMSDVT